VQPYVSAAGYLGGMGAAAIDYGLGTNLVGMGSPTVSLMGGGQLMVTGSGGPTPFQQGVSSFNSAATAYAQYAATQSQQAWQAQTGAWMQEIAAGMRSGPSAASDPSAQGWGDYLWNAAGTTLVGDYSGAETNVLGVGGSLALGFTGVDIYKDAADWVYGIQHWENSWSHVGNQLLNTVGLLPVVGMVKNFKYVDELVDASKIVTKNLDEAATVGKTGSAGIARARQLGQAGEEAVGIMGPKVGIRVPGTNQLRFPDALTNTTLTEVKNVGSLSYSQQLRDYATYCQQNGLRYELWVRPSTRLSGPLLEARDAGQIMIKYIPGAK